MTKEEQPNISGSWFAVGNQSELNVESHTGFKPPKSRRDAVQDGGGGYGSVISGRRIFLEFKIPPFTLNLNTQPRELALSSGVTIVKDKCESCVAFSLNIFPGHLWK